MEDYTEALEVYKKALILKPYDNFDIKDKIHKLEIYLLDNKEKETIIDEIFESTEILEETSPDAIEKSIKETTEEKK